MTRDSDDLLLVVSVPLVVGSEHYGRRDVQRRGSSDRDRRRIALYSHDTQGLGHVRRNTLLAAAIVAADPGATVLLVCGAREAAALPLPERTNLAVVPAVAKDRHGAYSARSSTRSVEHVVALRAAALERALLDYAPHLLVVDKVSRGFGGELEPTLRRLRHEHGTRTVLGLRDVLDDVVTTRREWSRSRTPDAVDSLYDEVWVYGDPAVFDPAQEYGWSDAVRAKVRYTGYLGSGRGRLLPAKTPTRRSGSTAPAAGRPVTMPYVLALVGGGQDGAAVADAFARAVYPPGHLGVLVTGPYLPGPDTRRVRRIERERGDLQVHRFVSDVPDLAMSSSATVSMGGYNSVCEVLAARRPALVVPRTAPRQEQSIRAERMSAHGLVDVLPVDDLHPDSVSRWLSHALARPDRRSGPIDLQGLHRVPILVRGLLEAHGERGARDVG